MGDATDGGQQGPATEPAEELDRIRRRRAANRRQSYQRSRLDPHRAELVALRRAGASLGELREWLRERGVRVARSTIMRALRRWPEAPAEDDHA